jgi:hypothetical protein
MGINNKMAKAIIQYDKDMNFIKEYYSVISAERETGLYNIGAYCKSQTLLNDFYWKFKD